MTSVPLANDGLESYRILEEIGRGASSAVYLAVCKHDRRRNRVVAIKKIARSSESSDVAHLASSTSLHQALRHPCVVSLVSTFSTPAAHFQVLEFCSGGTLAQFLRERRPPVLSEAELRGVTRSVVEALVYLRKERILHRDIKAGNILLTDDFSVRLADFGLATQLPADDSMSTTFCGSPNYVAPEIVARSPYSFPVDIWSLGCLMITCLTGQPPFEAPSVADVFRDVSRAAYTLPKTTSSAARSLISQLLQVNPDHRIPLHRILVHTFFDPALPVDTLRSPAKPHPPLSHLEDHTPPLKSNLASDHRPYKRPSSRTTSIAQATHDNDGQRWNHGHFTTDPRHALREEIATAPTRFLARRVVSAPLARPSTTAAAAPERAVCSLAADFAALGIEPRPRPRVTVKPQVRAVTMPMRMPTVREASPEARAEANPTSRTLRAPPAVRHSLLMPPDSRRAASTAPDAEETGKAAKRQASLQELLGRSPTRKRPASPAALPAPNLRPSSVHGVLRPLPVLNPNTAQDRSAASTSTSTSTAAALPIGTTRPVPICSDALRPQTHKVSYGQLAVLPATRAVLVDFREGERRRGRRGEEVLVISSDGGTVRVYPAPHLSSPCCLAEPRATYVLDELPVKYWKRYNDAAKLVDQLKQRTPKLVIYDADDVKCTLMSNAPSADIEVLLSTAPLPSARQRRGKEARSDPPQTPLIRIRLSRQRSCVEIATFVAPQGENRGPTRNAKKPGEWMKKTLGARRGPGGWEVEAEDHQRMDEAEMDLMRRLARLVPVCEAMEGSEAPLLEEELGPASVLPKRPRPKPDALWPVVTEGTRRGGPVAEESPASRTRVSSALHSSTMWLPGAPTPHRRTSHGLREIKPVAHAADEELLRRSLLSPPSDESDPLQTRFIPSVGWCVRHSAGRPGGGGRYRLMFLDGVTMEVDVDTEYVEFTSRSGDVTRHAVRDCSSRRKVGERMRAFEEFVSLFDDR